MDLRGRLEDRGHAHCLGSLVHHSAGNAQLQPLQVLGCEDRALRVEDLPRPVREHGQRHTLVLVSVVEHSLVNALAGDRGHLGGVAEEGELRELGERTAAGRASVHDERHIGEAVIDRIESLRRRNHGLRQQVALHARGGCLLSCMTGVELFRIELQKVGAPEDSSVGKHHVDPSRLGNDVIDDSDGVLGARDIECQRVHDSAFRTQAFGGQAELFLVDIDKEQLTTFSGESGSVSV